MLRTNTMLTEETTNIQKADEFSEKGAELYNKGKIEKALECFTQAIKLNPKEAINWAIRGGIHFVKKDYENSLRDYNEAIMLDPSDANYYRGRGMAYSSDLAEYEKSIKDLNLSIKLDPSVAASYYFRGYAYKMLGDTMHEIENYSEAVRIEPKNKAYRRILKEAREPLKKIDVLIRIGKFNEMPLFLNIPSPFRWFKQLSSKEKPLAYFYSELVFYDQLKAKHEGSIIPERSFSKNSQFVSCISSNEKIIVQPYFLLLPKLSKLFVLWHEYGHYISLLNDELEDKSAFNDVYEAVASFYACCKLKLHFNTYIEIKKFSLVHRSSIKKGKDNNAHLAYEERYNKFYVSRELPIEERNENDHVYEFYRDKDALLDWYSFCFKEISNVDYQKYFNWDVFLKEIGWDNDEERWKYIEYKKV